MVLRAHAAEVDDLQLMFHDSKSEIRSSTENIDVVSVSSPRAMQSRCHVLCHSHAIDAAYAGVQELASTTDAGIVAPSPIPDFLKPVVPAQVSPGPCILRSPHTKADATHCTQHCFQTIVATISTSEPLHIHRVLLMPSVKVSRCIACMRHICDGIRSSLQAADALALLQWLGEELGRLPGPQQREALRLPLQVTAKLSSRLAARALRAFLLPPQSAPAASPSVPSVAVEEPAAAGRSPVSRVQSPRSVSALLPGKIILSDCNQNPLPAKRLLQMRTAACNPAQCCQGCSFVRSVQGSSCALRCTSLICSPETKAIRNAANITPAAGADDMFAAPDLTPPSTSTPAAGAFPAAQVHCLAYAPCTSCQCCSHAEQSA